jgi:parallel beta-helix repeat protein
VRRNERGKALLPALVKTLVPLFLFLLPLFACGSAVAASYHVDNRHPRASDSNSGMKPGQPLKTISAGTAKASPGDTVWVHSGTYREMLLLPRDGESPGKPTSIRAHPGANVAIKGSDVVTGWTRHSGSIWKRNDWAVNSQQVFVDGRPLQQIGSNCPFNTQLYEKKPILPPVGKDLRDMRAGTFYYDPSSKVLHVWLIDGSDPNRHSVEASVLDFLIPPQTRNHILLQGLNFSHSNVTSKGLLLGMANVWGKSWTVKECTFNYGDFAGIALTGEGHRIMNCAFNHNGDVGINLNGSDEGHRWGPVPDREPQNILLEGNETSFNNYRNFELGFQHGGIKAAVSCKAIQISRHKAFSNQGAGIWFDLYCRSVRIERSEISRNLVGIAIEISDDAVIAGNLVTKNKYQGIYVAASSDVTVENNTLDENGFGIVLHGMPRKEHPTLRNNKVRNNIIAESGMVDLVVYDHPSATKGNVTDHNLYYPREKKGVKIAWTGNSDYKVNYTDMRRFAKDTGNEAHSLIANPLWRDRASGDYSLKAGSPAIGVFGIQESNTPKPKGAKQRGNR